MNAAEPDEPEQPEIVEVNLCPVCEREPSDSTPCTDDDHALFCVVLVHGDGEHHTLAD